MIPPKQDIYAALFLVLGSGIVLALCVRLYALWVLISAANGDKEKTARR